LLNDKAKKNLDFSKIDLNNKVLVFQFFGQLTNFFNSNNPTLKPFLLSSIAKYKDINEGQIRCIFDLFPFQDNKELLEKSQLIRSKQLFTALYNRKFEILNY